MSGLLKKVVAIIFTAFPKKLPNMNPQKTVDMPEKNKSFIIFFIDGFMFLTLRSANPHPSTSIRP